MDATHEGIPHGRSSSGGFCPLSRINEVGADVRLRARLADPADEDVDSVEGDLVPVLG